MSAVAMYVLDELIERDAGTRIDGSRHDLFVLRLEEHSGGGYLWDMDQLEASGFAVVRDRLEAADREGIGGPVIRRGTAASPDAYRGSVLLAERRLWEPGPRYGRYGRKSDIISGNHVRRLV